MPLTAIEKVELDAALNMTRMLIEQDAASRVSFEWKQGGHPEVSYTPTVALEYISVDFEVRDKEDNDSMRS